MAALRVFSSSWRALASPWRALASPSARPLPPRGTPRGCAGLASPLARAKVEELLLHRLRRALDPSLVRVRQLALHESGAVDVDLEYSTAACPDAELRAAAARVLDAHPSTSRHAIRTCVRRPSSFLGRGAPESLQHVGSVLGVSSCKGGVGKSTVAVNLAFALAERGARVGLLDADIHGPSLPSLVALEEGALPVTQRQDNKLLRPPQVGGVKLMSYGFVAKGASVGKVSAAVMRGPMVSKVVTQLLSGTEWGDLDYLLVDLPPGTSDVHLTMCQTFSLTAAVVVTTPQRLSRVDVFKGIDMWNELKVPVLAVVENMAYFKDPRGEVHHPFGKTQLEAVREYCRVPSDAAFRLPIDEGVTDACDQGVPIVVHRPQSETAAVIREAAKLLVLEVARLRDPSGAHNHQQVRYDPRRGLVLRILLGPEEGSEYVLPLSEVAALEGGPVMPGYSSDDVK
ncbi:hypothetical protein AB1Y20_019481 [Prymnesium parvum]|uniref:MIP18 family-like domain-containing protein n=1 Tax=Prymnesium parvum TaxID=97485 RepID=A0AB34JUI6_PRYPA